MKKQEFLIQILKALPLAPQNMTTPILEERLKCFFDNGTEPKTISRRIQRYLLELFDQNLVDCSMTRPYSWSKKKNWVAQTLNSEAIIAFQLAEQQLQDFPEFIKSYISPWFQTARGSFAELSIEEKRFLRKVRITSKYFPVVPDQIPRYIWEKSFESIKENKQIKIRYKKIDAETDEEYVLNPLGLDVRDNVVYLIAHNKRNQNPQTFKLYRIKNIEVLEKSIVQPPGFKLDEFIKNDISRIGTGKEIVIQILLHREWWFILDEYNFGKKLVVKDSQHKDWKEASFKTEDSRRVREWLWGLEQGVILQKPRWLREEYKTKLKFIQNNYKK